MTRPVRIVLVDDHQVVRQGLRAILQQEPHFEIVGETGDGIHAITLISHLKPDIALVDIRLADMSGLEVCRHAVELSPHTRVIILTAYLDSNLVHQALRAGARGYLLKDAEQMALVERIYQVLRGEYAFDPRVTHTLAEYAVQHPPPEDDQVLLSPRELEILKLVAQGMTNVEIADMLYLSPATVKDYVRNITTKLGARNRVEAVTKAVRLGLI
ncbi:MAG: response regulator transcription factor [Chloroflexi bacterium]|nr:response regulator transcription factor [Chloroflexota bacterium]